MDWLAFVAALVGVSCVKLLWDAFDALLQRRAPRLRLVGSGLLLLAMGVPALWFLPYQSRGIFFGAVTGLFIAGAIDEVRRRQRKKRAA